MNKQTFDIPENCKATVEQTGNQIVITFEPNKVEFKKGDFITAEYKSGNAIAIIKDKTNENTYRHIAWISTLSNGVSIDSIWSIGCPLEFRYSTPEERQFILDKLKSEGWKYNIEKCELELIKWVPKKLEHYDYITYHGEIRHLWVADDFDERCIKVGNCFKSNSLDQVKVKQLFAEFIQKVKDEHGIDY